MKGPCNRLNFGFMGIPIYLPSDVSKWANLAIFSFFYIDHIWFLLWASPRFHAMGKPMILGDNPATHELYHEGDPGITFCKMGDARALADCILSLKKEACGEEGN